MHVFDHIHQCESSQLSLCNLNTAYGHCSGGLSKGKSYGRWSLYIVLEITYLYIRQWNSTSNKSNTNINVLITYFF